MSKGPDNHHADEKQVLLRIDLPHFNAVRGKVEPT